MSRAEAPPAVVLQPVDDDVLERLVQAALADSSADEVTPPLTAGEEWTPERVEWLRAFHRSRRGGLDGPEREATWAVLADGVVVGAVRLKRVAESPSAEAGLWLTRAARGRGVGRRAVEAVLAEARIGGVTAVRADTTATNGPALAVLRSLGFDVTPVDEDGVIAWLALEE